MTVPPQAQAPKSQDSERTNTNTPETSNIPPRHRAAPLKLRPKKPFRMGKGFWFGPIPAIIVVTLPIIICAVSYCLSPTTQLYFEAVKDSHSQEERNSYYAKAFNSGHDLDILKEQAMYLINQEELTQARPLLTKLANSKVNDPEVYLKLAQINLAENSQAKETKRLLLKAATIAKAHCQSFSLDTNDESVTLYDTANLLLDSSDIAAVLDICKMKPHETMNDAHINYLKGLVLREQGKEAESLAILNKVEAKNSSDWDGKELESYAGSAKAMLALDRSAPSGADKFLKNGHKSAYYDWVLNVPRAWVAYEQGNYKRALSLSNKGMDMDKQAEAAMSLLRSHIYRQQKKVAEAKEALQTYTSQGRSGIAFIPKPYRHWITEARAGQK